MRGRRTSEVYHRYETYGEQDRPLEMDCSFWVVRSGSGVSLVDCGWNRKRGLSTADNRYSHIGNLDLFPRAKVILSRAEYECWTGPYGTHQVLAHSVRPDEVQAMRDVAASGRLELVEEPAEVLAGIHATPVGGHTWPDGSSRCVLEVGVSSWRRMPCTTTRSTKPTGRSTSTPT